MKSQHAVSAFDIPHRIVFNYVWEIPYGKRFGNVSSTAVDLLLARRPKELRARTEAPLTFAPHCRLLTVPAIALPA